MKKRANIMLDILSNRKYRATDLKNAEIGLWKSFSSKSLFGSLLKKERHKRSKGGGEGKDSEQLLYRFSLRGDSVGFQMRGNWEKEYKA